MGADEDAWVDAAPFRAHLEHVLASTGLSPDVVALAAGVSPTSVAALRQRRPRHRDRIRSRDARALLSLDPMDLGDLAGQQVRSLAARRAVAQLRATGCPSAWIAENSQVDRFTVEELRHGSLAWTTRLTSLRLQALAHRVAATRTRSAATPATRIAAMSPAPCPDAA
ncbi:hypothetical protein [Luteococcus peritonei]|uniref:Uncharacterized protein n=1 Tax=Luteococcus peritonei TaxID=88874 RepID=A0ABW4RS45_9ACTN